MNPVMYYAAFALWGIGITGIGSIYGRPILFYSGLIMFIINTFQFVYWLSVL